MKNSPISLGLCLVLLAIGNVGCSDSSDASLDVKISNNNKTCSADDECSGSKICVSGICQKAETCETDADCSGTTVCQDGSCIHSKCKKDKDCSTGLICDDGLCVVEKDSGDQGQDGVDSDGDGISDEYDRCDEDTDGDTIPNCKDMDSDGDGIPDRVEAGNGGNIEEEPIDSDDDGLYDFLDTDSDNNGIEDRVEAGSISEKPVDSDNDGVPDYRDEDNDGDGVSDEEEIAGLEVMFEDHIVPGRLCGSTRCDVGSPAKPWDSDGDTIPDYMDEDSDKDGIPDSIEGRNDSDGDGVYDRYSKDSDGDGVLDSDEVDSNGKPLRFVKENGETVYCYRTKDCDEDGLTDDKEIACDGKSAINIGDIDGDGFPDGVEYFAAKYAMEHPEETSSGLEIHSMEEMICHSNRTVKDVFEFYFRLPYMSEAQSSKLLFSPVVQKLDVVFNVDTSAIMDDVTTNIKKNINDVISDIQTKVPDTGIGLTGFEDFPVGTIKSRSGSKQYVEMCGVPEEGDLPFHVIGAVSTDSSLISSYSADSMFKSHNGGDYAESGVEALYQIVTGEGVSWNGGTLSGYIPDSSHSVKYTWMSGSLPARQNAPGTWGGVDWRDKSLPVVVHISNKWSHDKSSKEYRLGGYPGTTEYISYEELVQSNPSIPYIEEYVPNPHYTYDLVPKLVEKGVRVITLNVASENGTEYCGDILSQMTIWSKESNAIVPVCAFNGECGNNCCNGSESTRPTKIKGRDNQCVLNFKLLNGDVSTQMSKGVDALLRYGTYDVAARVIGEPIPGSDKTTSCFIKEVVADSYIAPPEEPEKSCNPVAEPVAIGDVAYQNGFTNFAPGTSSANKKGAELQFVVNVQNDCVSPSDETQIYMARIEIYNPATEHVFATRKVSILIPASGEMEVVY